MESNQELEIVIFINTMPNEISNNSLGKIVWNSVLERDGMYIVKIFSFNSCLMIVHSTNIFSIFNVSIFYMLRALDQRKKYEKYAKKYIFEKTTGI